jgi:ABC transport system ATP-binding/permease protein
MHLLSVDRVTAEVEGRTLFADVSFGLTSNDRVAVVGPNGSGKTTLLRIIAGDRAPDGARSSPAGAADRGPGPGPDLGDLGGIEVVLAGDPLAQEHEAEPCSTGWGSTPAIPTRCDVGRPASPGRARGTLLSPATC